MRVFQSTTFTCPSNGECIFNIGKGFRLMEDATIYGSTSNNIIINCGGYDEFDYDSFDISSDWKKDVYADRACGQITINATAVKGQVILYGGPGAFSGSEINCPHWNTSSRGYPCEFHGVKPLASWDLNYSYVTGFATFWDVHVQAYEGLNDINLFCDDKSSEDGDLLYKYDPSLGDYTIWAVSCIDRFDIFCEEVPLSASISDADGKLCYLQLVDPSSLVGSGFENVTIESKRYQGYDWICSRGSGTAELSTFFTYYCLNNFPSMNPTMSPTVIPTLMPSNQTQEPSVTTTMTSGERDSVVILFFLFE